MDLGQVLRSLGFQLGLLFGIAGSDPVALNEIQLHIANSVVIAETNLENCWSSDLEELLSHHLEIGILYRITVYTKNDKKRVWTQYRSLQYQKLQNSYQLIIDDISDETTKQDGINRLTSVSVPVNIENGRLLIITAELSLPAVEDRELVRTLWGGDTPSKSIRL